MYRNLAAEMARKGATRRDVAKVLGCSPGTVSLKLRGKAILTLPEAQAIKEFLGVDVPIEELFADDGDRAS